MTVLLPEQAEALGELQAVCRELDVDVVVIGATAYRAWVHDEHRATEDVDTVVALDLTELPRLTEPLTARGWRQDQRREHRWFSPKGARVDLIPAGVQARREKRLTWPRAETTMSLIGYGHVFSDAVERELAPNLRAKVVPLVVLALLKIVSYLDQPDVRQKDLQDLAAVMHAYEEDGERRFSDEVLDAGVDYTESGAYLLGRDLAPLCMDDDERAVVERFLQRLSDPDSEAFSRTDWVANGGENDRDQRFARESVALARGFHEIAGRKHG